ncbi:MAG: type II toxin-antitoxin system VapB family antitoxin [Sphingomonadales bacterium]
MALNIKDDEIHEMARELAELQGSSLTEAVRGALRAALDRKRVASDRETRERFERIMEIARRFSALPDVPGAPPITPDRPASDHSWLYDENGLPI